MRPRKYLHRIEVYRNETVSDGYSGNTVNPVKIADSWCNIKSVPVEKLEQFGLSEVRSALIITVRHRNDLDWDESELSLKYKGREYFINRVTEKDLNGYEFELLVSGSDQGS